MGFFKSQMWKVLEWKDNTQDTMVYRFDMKGQEIMSGSQLTVRESQVAIFVHQGKIADVFGPGQHKLETRNIPILSGLGAIFYQGESRFKAELYFVNTKQFLDRKWGTSNPIPMRDPEFGMIRIRAFGNYAFRVTEPTLFLKEVFGTNGNYTVSEIENNMKKILVSQISDTIAESKISALDMACNYEEFGHMVQENARKKFNAIGLDISDFNIENISFPEAVEKAIDERSSLGILGGQMDNYTRKKAADAMGDAANNPSGADGAGMGMMGMAMAMQMMNNMNANTNNQQPQQQPQQPQGAKKFCSECGAQITPGAKFCPECGAKQNAENVCPNCGTKLNPGAKFCPECGTKI